MLILNNISEERISLNDLEYKNILQITDSKIKDIDLSPAYKSGLIIIRNCIIENLYLFGAHLNGGFIFENNTVKNWIRFEAGGHNLRPFILRNNTFEGFFHFFDCIFEDIVIIENNEFKQGSDLLGNLDEPVHTEFGIPPLIQNNVGELDLNHDMLTKLNLKYTHFE